MPAIGKTNRLPMLKSIAEDQIGSARKGSSMAMPSRMQQEAEEAEKFLEGLNAPTPEEPPVDEGPSDPPPAAPPTGDAEVQQLRAEVQRLQSMLTDENSGTWQHRFQVLQGKYNAELPRMAQQIKELQEQLSDRKKEPQAPHKPEYEDAYNDLVDEHGPTTAKSILAIAEGLAQEKIAEMRGQFETQLQETLAPYGEQVQRLEQTQAQTAQERFFGTLDHLVPDWKQINGWVPDRVAQDPKFTKFLDQIVPGTGWTYNDFLMEHYKSGNALKVKEIFDVFKQANPAPAAPSKGVEQYIDPSKTGRASAPPTNNQPRTYSKAEVDGFFDSRVKGTFRGTREEANRLEAEYSQAIVEGRVR